MSKIFRVLKDINPHDDQQYDITILLSPLNRFHMLRHISFALIALIACVAHPSDTLAQNIWIKTVDREAGFTISFPGKPTYEQSVDPKNSSQSETYKFRFGENFLSITFAPFLKPIHNTTELNYAWTEITREMSRSGMLLRQEKLPDGARQFDNLKTNSNETLYMRTRVYLRSGRHYQLVYGTFAPSGINEQVAEKFFSSFRIGNMLGGKRTLTRNRVPGRGNQEKIEPSKWYKFKSPDAGFVVEFPGRPEYRLLENPDTGIPDHKLHFFFGESVFMVTYRMVLQANTDSVLALRHALQSYLTVDKKRWQVMNQLQLPGGGYDIESRRLIDDGPVYMRTRLFIHGARLYYITVMVDKPIGANKVDIDKFFMSFHFL